MNQQVATMPEGAVSRGIDQAQWNTLLNSLYPGAKPDSVLMVIDYCKARQLDPMKKPCHIVPMQVTQPDGKKIWRDVVMPGIYEYRTTAQRTGDYLGHSKPEYGPEIEVFDVKAPEWCAITVYRWNERAQQRIEYPVTIYFREACATRKRDKNNPQTDLVANQRWATAPIQMLTKCAEAAALREAFPDELGGTHTEDEMAGRVIDTAGAATSDQPASARPALEHYPQAKFDELLPKWKDLMVKKGKKADDIIKQAETKGIMTEKQKQTLRDAEPTTIDQEANADANS